MTDYRTVSRILSRGKIFAALGLVAAASVAIPLGACQRHDPDHGRSVRPAPAATGAGDPADISVATGADGQVVVHLSDDAIHRADLVIVRLAAASGGPQTVAYGTFIADPAHSFTLRAPVAGIVEAPSGSWPELGSHVRSAAPLLRLVPVLAAADRVSLSAQLAAARGQVTSDQALFSAAQAAYLRARLLNSEAKNLSDSALQAARAARDAEAGRLRADREQARLLTVALANGAGGKPELLESPAAGEITQVRVAPGESVQAGTPLAQISDFHTLVAKIEIPVGEPTPPLAAPARIVPAGDPGLVLPGHSLGLGDDPSWQGGVRLYRVTTGRSELRPGMPVAAYLQDATASGSGVVIPRSAVIYMQGEAWAYVERDDGDFVRQPVPTDRSAPGGYYAGGPWKPGVRIVVAGEQAILSQEQQGGSPAGDHGKKSGGDGGDDLDG